MELICISNRSSIGNEYINITTGKKYTLLDTPHLNYLSRGYDFYWIVDDFGSTRGIDKTCFMTTQEWRDSQMFKIGI